MILLLMLMLYVPHFYIVLASNTLFQLFRMPNDLSLEPFRPIIVIAGVVIKNLHLFLYAFTHDISQASAKKSDREFIFDINQYLFSEHRTVGHVCHFSETNHRFAGKKLFPHQGSHTCITGTISGSPSMAFGSKTSSQIPIDVMDIAFLAPDITSTPFSSPLKGMTSFINHKNANEKLI